MKKKILVVTSSRADFGILSNLIYIINKEKKLNLKLVITGSHLSKKKHSSFLEINNLKIKNKKILNINFHNLLLIGRSFLPVLAHLSMKVLSWKPGVL